MNDTNSTRLSLGPLQFHWPKSDMQRLYRQVADSQIDIVYLGETVCSKRREFRHQDWIDTAEQLIAAGKSVVFSTYALVEAQSELGYIRRLCENGELLVEANDMSAVQMLAGKVPFVGGPTLNIFNQRALQKLVDLGLQRWVVPVEMTRAMLAQIRDHISAPIEVELPAWGRLPLAYSARCYTARAHRVSKDDCETVASTIRTAFCWRPAKMRTSWSSTASRPCRPALPACYPSWKIVRDSPTYSASVRRRAALI